MKRCLLLAAVCVLAAIGLTVFCCRVLFTPADRSPSAAVNAVSRSSAAGAQPLRQTETVPAVPPSDADLTFSFLCDGERRTVSMAEYLPGVLAGEMPASFEPEALRAQAVAARTFVLYHIAQKSAAHPDADICADPACCQVWLDENDRLKIWGKDAEECAERIAAAVKETDGLYLSYADAPILACFHSSSARYTESCAAVWGTALPYLTSVPSPETAEDVPNYVTQTEFSPEELRKTLSEAYPEADFSGLPETWLGVCALDTSGRVAHIGFGGAVIPGTRLRALLSLRSTAFTAEWTGHSFRFTVTGFGHGAGMSQYGANVMARAGSSYEDILAHYYPGTELRPY